MYGSQSGFKGSYDDGYAVSKGGIHALVRTTALKLAPDRRIVAVAPGIASDTRMTENRAVSDLDEIAEKIPMKRLVTPRELSEFTVFLLSDACAYMTRCTIDLNGGNYLR